jgi:hypothetical protein
MTQKLETKITDDNITPSERSEHTGSDELVTLQTANRFHVVQSDMQLYFVRLHFPTYNIVSCTCSSFIL